MSDRLRLRPVSSALGEHIAVTEEAAGHRKVSRSSVEASDLRRTVAGTEPLPARHVMCPGSNHAPRAQFLLFEHVRRWLRAQVTMRGRSK